MRAVEDSHIFTMSFFSKLPTSYFIDSIGIIILPFLPLKTAVFFVSFLNFLTYYREYQHVTETSINDSKIKELELDKSPPKVINESISNYTPEVTSLSQIINKYNNSKISKFNRSVYITSSLTYLIIFTPWQLGLFFASVIDFTYLSREISHLKKVSQQEATIQEFTPVIQDTTPWWQHSGVYQPPALNNMQFSTMINQPPAVPIIAQPVEDYGNLPRDSSYFSLGSDTSEGIDSTHPPTSNLGVSAALNNSTMQDSPPPVSKLISPKIAALMSNYQGGGSLYVSQV